MLKILKLLLIFICLENVYARNLDKYCDELGGKVYKKYKCPKSKLLLPIKTCEYKSLDGKKQFFNGCSGPTGEYEKLFYSSCITHDLCYHHEPATNGLTQKDCDQMFKKNLLLSCETIGSDEENLNKKECISKAKFMYRALRVIGVFAYHCDNSVGEY